MPIWNHIRRLLSSKKGQGRPFLMQPRIQSRQLRIIMMRLQKKTNCNQNIIALWLNMPLMEPMMH